jgi:uncharacterized membrane protein
MSTKMGNDLCIEITLTNDTPVSLRKAITAAITAMNAALGTTVVAEDLNTVREMWMNNSGNGTIRMINNFLPVAADPDATTLSSANITAYGYKLANGPNGRFSNVNLRDTILCAHGADAVLDIRLVF